MSMYYGAGNYEAFAHPRKPEGIEGRHAYIVGTGLAALAAAAFLVRDARMPGENIHLIEERQLAGGACDGYEYQQLGFTMRGGREMDNHFECMWDLFRSIPSIEDPEVSVLDEYYWLNKDDPNYSLCRATEKRGQDAHTDKKFGLSEKGRLEVARLFLTPDEELFGKRIMDIFDDEVFNSNFWMYWRTMFAFENWHSALEMKRYIQRYVHHIGGLPDFTALRFTKYNQYESMILPLTTYLEGHGVRIDYGRRVVNVELEMAEGRKVARRIVYVDAAAPEDDPGGIGTAGAPERFIDLAETDLVFITNGGCVENATFGDQHHAARFEADLARGGGWDMWKRIAAQAPDGSLGHPEVFCSDPELTNWESATVETLDGEILPYIEAICKRDPLSGRVVTGGIVTARDSGWLLSWTINRQPQFRAQPKGHVLVWVYALFTDKPGDYVKKPMRDCTGVEICEEWLYHIGVPEERIPELAEEHANTVPCMMPYVTAFFMPRTDTDRPKVVPEGAVNFAFLGQFAETPRDTIFTTEYSIRTGMEAVYDLLDIDRAVPEVWGSVYDVRCLADAAVKLADGQKTDLLGMLDLNAIERKTVASKLAKVPDNDAVRLLKEYGVI